MMEKIFRIFCGLVCLFIILCIFALVICPTSFGQIIKNRRRELGLQFLEAASVFYFEYIVAACNRVKVVCNCFYCG